MNASLVPPIIPLVPDNDTVMPPTLNISAVPSTAFGSFDAVPDSMPEVIETVFPSVIPELAPNTFTYIVFPVTNVVLDPKLSPVFAVIVVSVPILILPPTAGAMATLPLYEVSVSEPSALTPAPYVVVSLEPPISTPLLPVMAILPPIPFNVRALNVVSAPAADTPMNALPL